jgi:phosphosulfolactate synthase
MSAEFYSLCNQSLTDPSGVRGKDSRQGITMVIDKGLGGNQFHDLLDTAGAYIDYVKLGFGTTALYPHHVLEQKLQLATKFGVQLYPGGTFFEVAHHQQMMEDYFETMKQIGFSKIEISDGTIELRSQDRQDAIQLAKEYGFDVITEYGKKTAGSVVEVNALLETIVQDLSCGSGYIIIEGRESGENVGIYDNNGSVHEEFFLLVDQLKPFSNHIIWEAPKKSQQVELMNWFGPNVHLGNIAPEEVYSVESLRRGLRSDTFFLGRER